MIRAIAFDFDGVLVESVDIKNRAYARLFEKEGAELVQSILTYHLRNGGVSRFIKFRTIYREILERPLSEREFQLLCDRFSRLVVEEVVAAPWVEGAQDFLVKNKDRYTFAIISGTPEDELKQIVRSRAMESFFDVVLGSPKEKVALLREVMLRFDLKSEEILFIGDSETDWNAARATKVPFFWRCSSSQVSLLSGYTGPRLSSLRDLDLNLRQLVSSYRS